MVKGSYTLLINVEKEFSTKISSIGQIKFKKGYYIYNGSAFGPGGFKRVERHRKLSEGKGNYTVHWHIDHLTSPEQSDIIKVFKAPEKDIEDEITQEIDLKKIKGFGAGDSELNSHLLYSNDRERAIKEIKESYRNLTDQILIEN